MYFLWQTSQEQFTYRRYLCSLDSYLWTTLLWDEQTAESWETCWCWLKKPVLAHFLTSGADPEGFPPGELARSHSHHSFCNTSTLELFRSYRFAHLVLLNLWLSLKHSNDFLHPWHLAELAVSDNAISAYSKGIWILAKALELLMNLSLPVPHYSALYHCWSLDCSATDVYVPTCQN